MNGTFVNDIQIEKGKPHTIKYGDFIGIGCSKTNFDTMPKEEQGTYYVFHLENTYNLSSISDDVDDEAPGVIQGKNEMKFVNYLFLSL